MAEISGWTKEEKEVLRMLRIDPARTDREKLQTLVNHFRNARGVWAVSEGATGPAKVSRGYARKVRNLVDEGKLDSIFPRFPPISGAATQGAPPLLRIVFDANSAEHLGEITYRDGGPARRLGRIR